MAAMMTRNDEHGNVTVQTYLAERELLWCGISDCPISYTLWHQGEDRIESDENVLDLLRRQAQDLVTMNHPIHLTYIYVWCGVKLGWLDKEEAKAAGM